jgi:hypothetical protein
MISVARKYTLHQTSPDEVAPASAQEPSSPSPSEHHLAILEALADGVDPFTGDELPDESVYQSAKVLRALLAGLGALKKQHEKSIQLAKLPAKAGEPWDEEEDESLLSAFDEGSTPAQLAEVHGRTTGAIKSRLAKKGRI